MSKGISDMHCMSDEYLKEVLSEEYLKKGAYLAPLVI